MNKVLISLLTIFLVVFSGVSQEIRVDNSTPEAVDPKIVSELKRLKQIDTKESRLKMAEISRQENDNYDHSFNTVVFDERETVKNEDPAMNSVIVNAVKIREGGTILANCTATMQRDSLKGTIVTVFVIQGAANGPDTLKVLWSRDNGISWQTKISRTTDVLNSYIFKVEPDEIDCEIVEDANGTKILWVLFGARDITNGNIYRVGRLSTNFQGLSVFGYFAFPSQVYSPNVRVYKPRICTDNSQYVNTAYLYLVAGGDSLQQGGSRPNYSRLAVLTDPYNMINPAINFRPGYIGTYNPNDGGLVFKRETDVAYLRRGSSDSILIGQSSFLADSVKLNFAKYSIFSPYAGTSMNTLVPGLDLGSSNRKSSIRIATNGNNNGIVYVSIRERSNGVWMIRNVRNTQYGNFMLPGNYTAGNLQGSATGYTSPGSIFGIKGSTNFLWSYTVSHNGSYQLMAVKLDGTNGSTLSSNIVNPQGISVTTLLTPEAGVRNVNNDSCLVMWSELGPSDVWTSLGCSGAVISGISGISNTADKFELSQNYPNPFNPVTKIRILMPKEGLAKLTVYDVTGQEVGVLVNENLKAGEYNVDFNASNLTSGVYFYRLVTDGFTDVKKMMLIK